MNKTKQSILLITACVLLEVAGNFCKALKRKLERRISKLAGI